MTEARLPRPWWLLALAAYSAFAAVQPTVTARLVAAAPIVGAAAVWWLLQGAERWTLAFLCAALVLPPLPIRIGDSGPHVAVAIAAVGVLAGLLRLGEWRTRWSRVELALPCYVLVLIASLGPAAFYSGQELAVSSLARVMLFGISVYLYFYTAHGPAEPGEWKGGLRLVFGCAVFSAIFACVDFYYQFPAPAGFGAQFVWLDSGVLRRAQGVFYEASTLGNLCASGIVLVAVCLVKPRLSPIGRTALVAGATCLSAALVLSFSRASLLNVGISIAALLWVERRRISRTKMLALVAVGGAACGALMYWAAPETLDYYVERLRTSVDLVQEGTGYGYVLSGRLESWGYLLSWLADHPWHALLGVGYKTLAYSDFVGRPVIADNAYLSALLETGLVGLAALIAASVAILKLAWRAARDVEPAAALFGTWIGCFWVGQMFQMLSGDLLTYWRVLPLYFWGLGMAVRYSTDHHEE